MCKHRLLHHPRDTAHPVSPTAAFTMKLQVYVLASLKFICQGNTQVLSPVTLHSSVIKPFGLNSQVIFYWAYVTRHICCCFDSMPSLRPALSQAQAAQRSHGGAEHQIALSTAQQTQARTPCPALAFLQQRSNTVCIISFDL